MMLPLMSEMKILNSYHFIWVFVHLAAYTPCCFSVPLEYRKATPGCNGLTYLLLVSYKGSPCLT